MKAILTDGVKQQIFNTRNKKGLDVWNDETPGAWLGLQNTAEIAVNLVPAIQSARQARCKALADLPFTIYKNDKEIDNSDDYKNVTGFMPNPRKFLWLTEDALVGYGKAYWLKKSNIYNVTKGMQYFVPSSVDAILEPRGLVRFDRHNGANTIQYKPEEVLYIWLPDPAVEIGPPTVWPLASAMLSAKALELINLFIKNYMERGAVKALLLAAKNMPSEEEATRVETWFNKFMRGVTNLRWKVFDAESITPTIVGEGLEAFKGVTILEDLTRQIHTAMGTRHMLEDENYATANVRQREFYTNTIVPDARIISDCLNEQILMAMGYRIEFNPERLEVFGEDEAENMAAFGTLSSALTNSSPEVIELSLSLAGVVLTDEQQIMLDAMKSEKEDNKEQIEEQMQPEEPITEEELEDDKMAEDMAKWMRKAVKRIGKDVPFVSDAIPEPVQVCIHSALPDCKTEDDIKAVFDSQLGNTPEVVEFQKIVQPDYSSIIEAMRMEVNFIKSQPAPPVNNYYITTPETKVTVEASKAPDVTVNMPEQVAPVVNVTNEVKTDNAEQKEFVKRMRKLSEKE